MPRPVIRVGAKIGVHRGTPSIPVTVEIPKSEPAGLPKPKTYPQRSEDPNIAAAKAAVENFENQKRMLDEMREDWEKNFPEASIARRDILQQEDLVVDAINTAKPLVAKAKQTIGDFKATRKFDKAHYDEKELTQILASFEDGLNVFDEMLKDGVIESLKINREAALAWFAQRPTYADAVQGAFKDEQEMTCAVTTPKI